MIPEFELLRQRPMRELQARAPADAAWLEASRALRLYGTIGSEAVLHSDGTVVRGDPPIPLRASTHHIRIYHDPDRVWEHTDELVLTLSIPEVAAETVRQSVMAWSDPSTSPEEVS